MFDPSKPTTQMLGRWQPWHDGHTELFKRAYAETGQVVIMVRTVFGYIGQDAGAGRTVVQDDNPFNFQDVVDGIKSGLSRAFPSLGFYNFFLVFFIHQRFCVGKHNQRNIRTRSSIRIFKPKCRCCSNGV